MRKRIISLVISALLLPSVLADYGHMAGYGMMGSYGWFYWLYGVVWFTLAAFVFSLIFWITHQWIVKGRKTK